MVECVFYACDDNPEDTVKDTYYKKVTTSCDLYASWLDYNELDIRGLPISDSISKINLYDVNRNRNCRMIFYLFQRADMMNMVTIFYPYISSFVHNSYISFITVEMPCIFLNIHTLCI